MTDKIIIRPMLRAELPFAAEYTRAEGWLDEDLSTFEAFYRYDSAGCFIAEQAGQALGICVATGYQTSGFIGELIVHPEVRNQGIGKRLLNHAIEYLNRKGAVTIYLDGMSKAVPLYERNGFRKICRSLRFVVNLPGKQFEEVRPMQPADLPAVCALDRSAFGEDRATFLRWRLERYPQLSRVLVEKGTLCGYILGKRGSGWANAGPWVVISDSSQPERLLISLANETNGMPLSLGVLESNQQAVELMRSLQCSERAENPWRMACGPTSDLGASPACYAIGSPAKG